MLLLVCLSGCSSIPLTTMYKLSRLNPMEADPGQIKIAIRAHQAIGIPHGAARISLGYETHDKNTIIEDVYFVEIIKNSVLTPELTEDKSPLEHITILQLSAEDAQRMRTVQELVKTDKANDVEGSGYLGVGLHDTCLNQESLPQDGLTVDIFMQTSNQDGYFIFTEDFNITETRDGWNGDLSQWPQC